MTPPLAERGAWIRFRTIFIVMVMMEVKEIAGFGSIPEQRSNPFSV
jgi:hypothetical protein